MFQVDGVLTFFVFISVDGVCTVFGDPHYRTYDGKFFSFQGPCKYLLSADCVTNTFSIRVTNDARNTKNSAWTKTISLRVIINGKIFSSEKVGEHRARIYRLRAYYFTDRRFESEPWREQTDQNQRTEGFGTVQEKQRTDHNQHERYRIGGDQDRCIDRLGRTRILGSFGSVEIQR